MKDLHNTTTRSRLCPGNCFPEHSSIEKNSLEIFSPGDKKKTNPQKKFQKVGTSIKTSFSVSFVFGKGKRCKIVMFFIFLKNTFVLALAYANNVYLCF